MTDNDLRAERRAGLLATWSAFIVWGVMPVYWRSFGSIPPVEVVCHRVLWSTLFLSVLVSARRGWPRFFRSVSGGQLRLLVASGLLIGANWALFIWAVNSGRVLETSLAFFINPLVSALIGCLAFSERLRRMQVLALLLAALGVANMALSVGGVPWLALAMALSFAVYGALHKVASVSALDGLLAETALLSPLSVAYLALRGTAGPVALAAEPVTAALLIGAGVVTSVPLLAFSFGLRRLPLVTVGLLQFIAPSLTFLLGVFAFREPFTTNHLVTFALIWSGVLAYAAEGAWAARSSAFRLVVEAPE